MAKAVALFDSVLWTDGDGAVHEFFKGEEQDLPQPEFDRLEAMGAVASPRSKDAKAASADAEAAGQ